MIQFWPSEFWIEVRDQFLADPSKTIIDLRDCRKEHEYVLKIEDKLHGKESYRLETGRSLDALADNLTDFFFENWLKNPQIYIVGWKGLIDCHPVFSQKLLLTIVGAYQNTIWGQARAAFQGEESLQNLKIHEEIQNGTKFYLFLN